MPITIGTVRIEPGDWVVGDEDGVVVVPAALAGDVLRVAETKVGTESAIRDAVRDGMTPLEAYERFGFGRSSEAPQPGSRPGVEGLEHDLDEPVGREHVLAGEDAGGLCAAGADRLADRAMLEVVLRVQRVELCPGPATPGRR